MVDVFLTVHHSTDLSKYQLSVHSLNTQQYKLHYTPQHVSSSTQSALHPHTVRLLTEGDDTRGCGDTIGPPDDEQRAARNMLRSVM